jgi:hemoglobin/transferrin/lactoferrin receptor protein
MLPRLLLAAPVLCLSAPLAAQTLTQPDDAAALDAVIVTAARTAEAVGEVAATASAVTDEQIDRQLARDIRDLVRYEPGVSVSGDASRFGLSGFTIRGLGGNRVAIEVDGIPLSDAFAIGSFSNAGRDAVDVDLLKQVEIVRGPGSSLYGSDALAGVVGFVTKDPDDFVSPDDAFYARAKLGLHGVDDGEAVSALVAQGSQRWSTLVSASVRRGHERENQGDDRSATSSRTAPNPQDYTDRSLLAKLLFDASSGHRLKLTVDALRSDTDTDVISSRSTVAPGPSRVRTDLLLGDDAQRRDRVSFDYRIEATTALFDEANFLLYRQDSETEQDTFERRTTIAASGVETPSERERRFAFDQRTDGFEATLRRDLEFAGADHRLVYGLDWQRTDTAQQRDGLQRNLVTGATTPVIGPDAFPVRDFPLSETTETAVYLQDRIRWLDGRVELTPGLRWDSVELEPRLDPVFADDNPGVTPQPAEHDEASPKLAAAWRLDDAWSVHALWAKGFRAPPYSDVNVGFTNLQFGYTALPNPDLRPETSRGGELGLRVRGEGGYVAFTVFRNEYRDFIESFVSLGVDPVTGLLVFQSQNIADVTIEGAELRGALDLGAWLAAMEGWRIDTALSYARGDDETHDAPLDSIDPARAVVGLGYATPDGRWDVELIGSAVQRKTRIDDSAGSAFRPDGHVLLDLLAQWRPTTAISVHAGVFNLLDKTYWEWNTVRGRSAVDAAIDRYSAPGRNVGVNLILEF